jgi:putative phage-type endonuclease
MNTTLVPVGALDRATYLGGSDIAAIMGLSPWATPLDVYLRKIGEVPDAMPLDKMRIFKRGKRLEPIAIDMLIEEYGINVTRRSPEDNPNRYRDAKYPFMAAEIDFEWADDDGVIQNGEIKTVHNLVAYKWGEEDTEDIPVEYAAQCMWGLGITGRDRCMVGALIGADNLLRYTIERDEATIEGMRAKAVDFWNNNVLARKPPDPVNMTDMMHLFARVRGRPVQLDEDAQVLVGQLANARAAKKSAADAEEDLKFRICDYIRLQWNLDDIKDVKDDNALLLVDEKTVATWKAQSMNTIDVNKLRHEQPEIATKYNQTTHTRVLRIKK